MSDSSKAEPARWEYGKGAGGDPAARLDERLRSIDLAIAQAMDRLTAAVELLDAVRADLDRE